MTLQLEEKKKEEEENVSKMAAYLTYAGRGNDMLFLSSTQESRPTLRMHSWRS